MNSPDESIYVLLAAYFSGEELEPEENGKLEQWKNASPRNLETFRYYQDLFEKRQTLAQWDKIEFTADMANRIFSTPTIRYRRVMKILKYAAVICLPILITFFLLYRQSAQETIAKIVPLASQDIAPGKQKARLLLGNGEVFSLADSSMTIQAHKNIQVENGGVLQYAANEKPAEAKAVYHTLAVDRGAEFQLVLADGTKVWLNSDSELTYPDVFNEKTRQVYLKGEAYFEVAHSERQPFLVKAGECSIRVLGTAFNVSSYAEEKEVVTTLVNGKVAYEAGNNRGELIPGEQCVYAKENGTAKVWQVDVNQFISWKNGLFVFDSINMEELAQQISRWYNVEVVFPDNAARKVSFTGAMERNKPVSYLIQLLNETNTVDCRLEGNVLVFRKK